MCVRVLCLYLFRGLKNLTNDVSIAGGPVEILTGYVGGGGGRRCINLRTAQSNRLAVTQLPLVPLNSSSHYFWTGNRKHN